MFNKRPSQINGFLWEITWEDVRICTDLRLGEVCATTGEVKHSLVNVVDMTMNSLFGSKDKSATTEGNVETVHTAADFRKAFDKLGM